MLQSLRQMHHANVVRLREVVREQNELYFVFECLDCNLYEFMRRRCPALSCRPEPPNAVLMHSCQPSRAESLCPLCPHCPAERRSISFSVPFPSPSPSPSLPLVFQHHYFSIRKLVLLVVSDDVTRKPSGRIIPRSAFTSRNDSAVNFARTKKKISSPSQELPLAIAHALISSLPPDFLDFGLFDSNLIANSQHSKLESNANAALTP